MNNENNESVSVPSTIIDKIDESGVEVCEIRSINMTPNEGGRILRTRKKT